MIETGYFLDGRYWYIKFTKGTHQLIAGFENHEESFEVLYEGHYNECLEFIDDMRANVMDSMF